MPVISSFNNRQQSSISSNVQSANIDRSGAGATAKALSNVASGIGQIANEYLLLQKKDQAENYKNQRLTQKDEDRTAYMREAMTQMDRNTGLMPDGRSYYEHMEEFENVMDDDALANAPTDMAAREYKASSISQKRNALMAAEKFQFETIKSTRKMNVEDQYSTDSKKLLGADDELLAAQGTSALAEARKSIGKGVDSTISGTTAGLFTQTEAELLQKNGASSVSNAYFDNAIFNNRLPEAIEQLDAPVLATEEDLSGPAGQELAETLGTGPLDKVMTMPDGSTAYFFEKGNKDTAYEMDTETGEMVKVRYPDMQKFNLGPIDISGEVNVPPKMDKYLTVKDKKRVMGNILSKLMANKRENTKKLRADVENAISAYSATDDTKLRVRPGTNGHYGTDTAKMLSARIWASDLDDTEKYKMAGSLYGAILEGDFKDASTWASPTRSASMIDNVSENIDTVVREFGAEEMLTEKLDTAKLKRSVRDHLQRVEATRLRETLSPDYVYKNDGKLNRKYQDFTSSFLNGNYQRAATLKAELDRGVKARQEQLGLPSFAQSIYNNNFMSTVSDDLNGLMDRTTGYQGAYQLAQKVQGIQTALGDESYKFIQALKINHNLNQDIAYAGIFPQTEEGLKASALYLDSVSNKKNIQSNYVDTLGKEPDFELTPKGLRNSARTKIAPMVSQISRGSTTSEREAQIRSLTDAVATRAMKLGGNVDQAFKELVDSNYLTFVEGGAGFAVPRAELERANITDDEYKNSMRFFRDMNNIPGIEDVPWEEYAGGNDLKGLSKSQRDKIVKSRFEEGKQEVIPVNNTGSRVNFVLRSDNGSADPLINSKGEVLEVPLKDIKTLDGFDKSMDEANSFWGRRKRAFEDIIN